MPGGWVAEKFSAKHVFGTGALINAICAIITPVAANTSYIFLIILRIIMGIAGVSTCKSFSSGKAHVESLTY